MKDKKPHHRICDINPSHHASLHLEIQIVCYGNYNMRDGEKITQKLCIVVIRTQCTWTHQDGGAAIDKKDSTGWSWAVCLSVCSSGTSSIISLVCVTVAMHNIE